MNKGLGAKILKLRKGGLSYNKISGKLKCSKGTVAFHCGTGQKDKSNARAFKRVNKKKECDKNHRLYLIELSLRYKRLCGCKECGNKNPFVLQFDHKDNSGKISSVAALIADRNSIESVKTEIRKCEILCANCHAIKTVIQLGYYKEYIKKFL